MAHVIEEIYHYDGSLIDAEISHVNYIHIEKNTELVNTLDYEVNV